jgi:hypothetical protein
MVCISAFAQQPFKKYGYKVKVATLSKGKYVEHFDQDTIVQIGTVMFNRRSGRIVSFVEYDTTLGEYSLQPDLVSRWMSPDPLAHEFYSESPYNFVHNNPIKYMDPDGREPIKPFVGTVAMFRALLDNSPRKVGGYTGDMASNYLKSLGNTEFSWSQMRPLPTEAGYFNKKEGRYIYTEKGGWIDMSHFLFYAGKAYQYKLDGKENPIGEAVQDGYKQEMSDRYAAKHSAYSYEDLPSDKFGSEFATNFFDPKSKQTFGEQIVNYLTNILKATDPKNAPNYEKLPTKEPDKPTRTNKTTDPVYTKENK